MSGWRRALERQLWAECDGKRVEVFSALTAMPAPDRLALARELLAGTGLEHIAPPSEPTNPADGVAGADYFRHCISAKGHTPAVHGKYAGAHQKIIRGVYEEALTRFPEAADVIAALVFWKQVDRNRDELLAKHAAMMEGE